MSREVLSVSGRRPLRGRSLEEFIREVRQLLAGRIEAAYLFGSAGTPQFGRHSDIDLILVAETDTPFIERPLLFEELLDRFPSLDLLVYTPEEFAQLSTDPSPGFWRSVTNSMRRIV